MKKQISFYILFTASLAMMLIYHGCSELENDLVVPDVPGVHGAGWTNPSSPNFHGSYIADHKWNLSGCKTCHANDYQGGNTGLSCYKCHHNGPESCTTCHGGDGHANPPKGLHGETSDTSIHVGAHFTHLNDTARFSAFVECNECHIVPSSFDDSTHIGPNPDGVAEINFGPLARTVLFPGVTPNPQFNYITGTCSSVYCHGTFLGGNLNNSPTWTNPNSAACGTCHGLPPQHNHDPGWTITQCGECHSATMTEGLSTITHPEKHVNGVLNFAQ